MSQWGKVQTVGKAKFIVHVKTDGFQPVQEESRVELVMLLDDGGDKAEATTALNKLNSEYVGKPYYEWMGMVHNRL